MDDAIYPCNKWREREREPRITTLHKMHNDLMESHTLIGRLDANNAMRLRIKKLQLSKLFQTPTNSLEAVGELLPSETGLAIG